MMLFTNGSTTFIKGHCVTAYVIMPNHLHLLFHYAGGATSLNLLVGNAKRFLAYEIVKRLKQGENKELLQQLSGAVEYKDQQRGKQHEVWQDSFDWKECRTEKFILQKLSYLHSNPCFGRWQLAESPLYYPHSSACFYHNGKHVGYPVTNYREVLSNMEE
jgi:REP element-mobilizing transposase RayT